MLNEDRRFIGESGGGGVFKHVPPCESKDLGKCLGIGLHLRAD